MLHVLRHAKTKKNEQKCRVVIGGIGANLGAPLHFS